MGERTICLDEMTGIQALERLAPDLPLRPAKIQRREFEYIRHGTQTLIASFEVASGRVIHSTVGDTRTEADYVSHVQQTIATDPDATQWHAYYGLLKHSSIRIAGALCGTSGRVRDRPGYQGQEGYFAIHGNPNGVFNRPNPSNRLSLHPKALLLAQPN